MKASHGPVFVWGVLVCLATAGCNASSGGTSDASFGLGEGSVMMGGAPTSHLPFSGGMPFGGILADAPTVGGVTREPQTGGIQSGGGLPAGGDTGKDASVDQGGKNPEGGSSAGGAIAKGGSLAGGAATGGTKSSTGGSPSACYQGATVSWKATDYVSRKWARWPIPNSPASGLPHPMRYTATTDGVLDQVTGLTWQKSTSPTGMTWQEALGYCTELGPGWSLPTRIELTTVLRHDAGGSKIDPVYFTFGASAGWTWTSTPWVVNQRKNLTGAQALAWFINFAVGDSNNSLSQTNASGRARCVKIQETLALPAEHYTLANGEVRDNYTCLTWQQTGSGTIATLARDEAVAYCQDLSLNGEKWRLPSLNELASIVDDVPSGNVSPAVDHAAFPETSPNQKYWSTSGYGSPATTFWTLNFLDGFTQHPVPSTLGIARCVR